MVEQLLKCLKMAENLSEMVEKGLKWKWFVNGLAE